MSKEEEAPSHRVRVVEQKKNSLSPRVRGHWRVSLLRSFSARPSGLARTLRAESLSFDVPDEPRDVLRNVVCSTAFFML